MARLKVLITLSCLCVTAFSLPLGDDNPKHSEKPDKYRLPNYAVPIHYDVKVNPSMYKHAFDGETRIDFEIRRPTSNIVLNSKSLAIDESRTSLETKDGLIVQPIEHNFDEDDTEMLDLRFEKQLEPGSYALNFKFRGILNEHSIGFFYGYYGDKDDQAIFSATHFQKMTARRTFPCWDEPAIKATFNISVKHYDNYTALSNMPAYAEEIDESDGKVWTHFETTPILSTNILAFLVADFVNISNPDGTVRIWAQKKDIAYATYYMNIVERASEELSRYLNRTVGVPKMDHVALPLYYARATENWGLIVYQEKILFRKDDEDRAAKKILDIMTVIHELSHQWFGNLVSPAWWKYFWLSEGMATYFKYFIADKMFPEWRSMDTLATSVQYIFLSENRPEVPCINKDFKSPRDSRDPSIIYSKSSFIIRMLTHIVSEDVFHVGLQKYINKHEFSNVTSDDLWQSMEDALGESEVPHEKFQVKKVMDSWIEQSGYPLVTVIRDYTTGLTTIRQEISPTLRDKRRKSWWIPITYATKSNPDFSSTLARHWLRPSDENITIDEIEPNDWIILNVQEAGYYRVNYDPTNWRRIAEYLDSENYVKIHPVNRGQIINDALHLMLIDQLSPTIFMELTNYLSRETDFIPWNAVFTTVERINLHMLHHEGAALLRSHCLNLINNYIKTIGFDARPDDHDAITSARAAAVRWACKLGHTECREKAAAQLIAHLAEPNKVKISPDTEHWTYCTGLARANQSTWDKLVESLSERDELNYFTISYLACAEDPKIIEHLLNLAFTNDSAISKSFSNPMNVFSASLSRENPATTEAVLNYVIENWDRLNATRSEEVDYVLNELISFITKRDHFDKLKTFLDAKGINKDSQMLYLETAVEKIETNLAKILSILKNESNELQTTESTDTVLATGSP